MHGINSTTVKIATTLPYSTDKRQTDGIVTTLPFTGNPDVEDPPPAAGENTATTVRSDVSSVSIYDSDLGITHNQNNVTSHTSQNAVTAAEHSVGISQTTRTMRSSEEVHENATATGHADYHYTSAMESISVDTHPSTLAPTQPHPSISPNTQPSTSPTTPLFNIVASPSVVYIGDWQKPSTHHTAPTNGTNPNTTASPVASQSQLIEHNTQHSTLTTLLKGVTTHKSFTHHEGSSLPTLSTLSNTSPRTMLDPLQRTSSGAGTIDSVTPTIHSTGTLTTLEALQTTPSMEQHVGTATTSTSFSGSTKDSTSTSGDALVTHTLTKASTRTPSQEQIGITMPSTTLADASVTETIHSTSISGEAPVTQTMLTKSTSANVMPSAPVTNTPTQGKPIETTTASAQPTLFTLSQPLTLPPSTTLPSSTPIQTTTVQAQPVLSTAQVTTLAVSTMGTTTKATTAAPTVAPTTPAATTTTKATTTVTTKKKTARPKVTSNTTIVTTTTTPAPLPDLVPSAIMVSISSIIVFDKPWHRDLTRAWSREYKTFTGAFDMTMLAHFESVRNSGFDSLVVDQLNSMTVQTSDSSTEEYTSVAYTVQYGYNQLMTSGGVEKVLRRTGIPAAVRDGSLDVDGFHPVGNTDLIFTSQAVVDKEALDQLVQYDNPCQYYECDSGFSCRQEGETTKFSCISRCLVNYCLTRGFCTHLLEGRPTCKCDSNSGGWYTGERCDYYISHVAAVLVAVGVQAFLLACIIFKKRKDSPYLLPVRIAPEASYARQYRPFVLGKSFVCVNVIVMGGQSVMVVLLGVAVLSGDLVSTVSAQSSPQAAVSTVVATSEMNKPSSNTVASAALTATDNKTQQTGTTPTPTVPTAVNMKTSTAAATVLMGRTTILPGATTSSNSDGSVTHSKTMATTPETSTMNPATTSTITKSMSSGMASTNTASKDLTTTPGNTLIQTKNIASTYGYTSKHAGTVETTVRPLSTELQNITVTHAIASSTTIKTTQTSISSTANAMTKGTSPSTANLIRTTSATTDSATTSTMLQETVTTAKSTQTTSGTISRITQIASESATTPKVMQIASESATTPKITQIASESATTPKMTQIASESATTPKITQISSESATTPKIRQISSESATTPKMTPIASESATTAKMAPNYSASSAKMTSATVIDKTQQTNRATPVITAKLTPASATTASITQSTHDTSKIPPTTASIIRENSMPATSKLTVNTGNSTMHTASTSASTKSTTTVPQTTPTMVVPSSDSIGVSTASPKAYTRSTDSVPNLENGTTVIDTVPGQKKPSQPKKIDSLVDVERTEITVAYYRFPGDLKVYAHSTIQFIRQWDPRLGNRTSEQHMQFADAFKATVEPYYAKPKNTGFQNLEVVNLREGDYVRPHVVVDYRVRYNYTQLMSSGGYCNVLDMTGLPGTVREGELIVDGTRSILGTDVTYPSHTEISDSALELVLKHRNPCKYFDCSPGYSCKRDGEDFYCLSECLQKYCLNNALCIHQNGSLPSCRCEADPIGWYNGERCQLYIPHLWVLMAGGGAAGIIGLTIFVLSLCLCLQCCRPKRKPDAEEPPLSTWSDPDSLFRHNWYPGSSRLWFNSSYKKPMFPYAPGAVKPGYKWNPTLNIGNSHVGKLPVLIAIAYLAYQRSVLDNSALHDTYTAEDNKPPLSCPDSTLHARTADGSCNDLDDPTMGMRLYRFGRNAPIEKTFVDEKNLLKPNPRVISNKLFKRGKFIPATSINLLAAAWLQFQTHDWFDHGLNQRENPIHVPLPEDDELRSRGVKTLKVFRTVADPTQTQTDRPKTFRNHNTHWWDGSQLYGSDLDTQMALREMKDGKLKVTASGMIPLDENTGVEKTGFSSNWWVGLSMLHNLFTREHNAICDVLKAKYPKMTDQELFDKARLINAAVMAKLHTVEWTTALLYNDILHVAMNTNWVGFLGQLGALGDFLKPFLPSNYILDGIPGSKKELHGVPYSLTEEFTAVYRMHSILPDVIHMQDVASKKRTGETYPLKDTLFSDAFNVVKKQGMEKLFYTFGVENPGALVLHNFPNSIRDLQLPETQNSEFVDMATVDVLRDRERGVPRYNELRRHLNMAPVETFQDITDDPKVADELSKMYHGDVEMVDLLVGCSAESPRPTGFGFSDTAFRLFILMATRRLRADRFYTDYYNSATYTQEGLDWVEKATMSSVLLRHYPSLEGSLGGVTNAFRPWKLQQASAAPARDDEL
ncbi:Alpha-dioxygenase 2 [Branchiostoma belcheri]|nr:Alpha-dioxygenase 2 [Branchiostoma belcheri]